MYFNAGKKQQNYDSSGSDSGTNEISNQQHQHLTQQHPNKQHPNKQHPHHQHHQITSKINLLHQNITIQQNPQFNNPIYQPFFAKSVVCQFWSQQFVKSVTTAPNQAQTRYNTFTMRVFRAPSVKHCFSVNPGVSNVEIKFLDWFVHVVF